MAQEKVNVSEALRRAKEEEEDVFLARLNKDQPERSGFDTSTFGLFSYIDIYLMWDGDEYVLKYQFDSDPSQTYYERSSTIGGEEELIHVVETYIALGGEKAWSSRTIWRSQGKPR